MVRLRTCRLHPLGPLSRADNDIQVLSVKGREAMNEPYRYDIRFLIPAAKAQEQELVSAPWCLELDSGARPMIRHGFAERLKLQPNQGTLLLADLRLMPMVQRLSRSREGRMFVDRTAPAVIQSLLSACEIPEQRVDLNALGRDFPVRDFTWQYQEDSLSFLRRICEEEGIVWFFRQGKDHERIVFTHATQTLAEPDLRLQIPALVQPLEPPGPHLVQRFHHEARPLPRSLHFQGCDLYRPNLLKRQERDLDPKGHGICMVQGEPCANDGVAERRAMLREQALRCTAQRLHAEGWIPLGPGETFRMEGKGFPNSRCLTLSCLVEVMALPLENAGAAPLPVEPAFEAETKLEALPADTPYRPPLRERRARLAGQILARIAGPQDGTLAHMDARGRYRVAFSKELGGQVAGQPASAWFPLLQPYGGADHGMHLPLRKGADVLLAPIQGNHEHLVILGALPTVDAPSLVGETNPYLGRVRSAGGSELRFQDEPGKERLLLATKVQASGIALDADGQVEHWARKGAASFTAGDRMDVMAGRALDLAAGVRLGVSLGGGLDLRAGQDMSVLLGTRREVHLQGDQLHLGMGSNTEWDHRRNVLASDHLSLGVLPFTVGTKHLQDGPFQAVATFLFAELGRNMAAMQAEVAAPAWFGGFAAPGKPEKMLPHLLDDWVSSSLWRMAQACVNRLDKRRDPPPPPAPAGAAVPAPAPLESMSDEGEMPTHADDRDDAPPPPPPPLPQPPPPLVSGPHRPISALRMDNEGRVNLMGTVVHVRGREGTEFKDESPNPAGGVFDESGTLWLSAGYEVIVGNKPNWYAVPPAWNPAWTESQNLDHEACIESTEAILMAANHRICLDALCVTLDAASVEIGNSQFNDPNHRQAPNLAVDVKHADLGAKTLTVDIQGKLETRADTIWTKADKMLALRSDDRMNLSADRIRIKAAKACSIEGGAQKLLLM